MANKLKWLKYHAKEVLLGTWPQFYWEGRELFRGPLEPEMTLLPRFCRENQTVLDIGANWGAYGYRCAKLARHVHCFEPQPQLSKVLRRGIGRRANVTIHNSAVSNRNATAKIRIPINDIGCSTIEPKNGLNDRVDLSLGVKIETIPTLRLDDLEFETVSLIKIDVEGHELAVLEGAQELLQRDHPTLLVEAEDRHRPGTRTELVEW